MQVCIIGNILLLCCFLLSACCGSLTSLSKPNLYFWLIFICGGNWTKHFRLRIISGICIIYDLHFYKDIFELSFSGLAMLSFIMIIFRVCIMYDCLIYPHLVKYVILFHFQGHLQDTGEYSEGNHGNQSCVSPPGLVALCTGGCVARVITGMLCMRLWCTGFWTQNSW